MKKLSFLLFILTISMGITVSALGQTKKDNGLKIITHAKGGMVSHDGTKFGYLSKDDIVRDNQGQKVYFVDRNRTVFGADGQRLGFAKKDGFYYNINGENVLNTTDAAEVRCTILDPQGNNASIMRRNAKLYNCAIHCYWLEQAKLKQEKAKKYNLRIKQGAFPM